MTGRVDSYIYSSATNYELCRSCPAKTSTLLGNLRLELQNSAATLCGCVCCVFVCRIVGGVVRNVGNAQYRRTTLAFFEIHALRNQQCTISRAHYFLHSNVIATFITSLPVSLCLSPELFVETQVLTQIIRSECEFYFSRASLNNNEIGTERN